MGAEALAAEVKACTSCEWARTGIRLAGEGPVPCDIMVVEPRSSRTEARLGRRFVTRGGGLTSAGKLLDRGLRDALGASLETIYLTDLVKSLPDVAPRVLPERILDACRFHLENEFAAVRPALIIALGREVGRNLIPGFALVGRDRGKPLIRVDGSYVVGTYHPSYAIRFGRDREFREDLHRAARLISRAPAGQQLAK